MRNIFRWLYKRIKRVSLFNKIHGKRKNCVKNLGVVYKCKIIFKGNNNVLHIDKGARMVNCRVIINGSNNNVYLGKNSYIENSGCLMDFNGNSLSIGENSVLSSRNHFSISEGTNISIGRNCLISANVHFRTTDSHSILNMQGERINWAQSITLEDHVWVGADVVFLKGAKIRKDSVVSYGAVVTKDLGETNCVVAGVPGKIVKREINWDKTLIKKEKLNEFI